MSNVSVYEYNLKTLCDDLLRRMTLRDDNLRLMTNKFDDRFAKRHHAVSSGTVITEGVIA